MNRAQKAMEDNKEQNQTEPGVLARVGTLGMSVYDGIMRGLLSPRLFRTYYAEQTTFVQLMNARYWHRTETDVAQMIRLSPVEVVGREAVGKAATRIIQRRALFATLVTILCAFPQSWIMWPLILVDVIVYQHQLFRVSQELCMLYRRRETWEAPKFDYKSAANLVLKIEGAFVGRQAKKGVGFAAQWAARKGSRFLRGPFKTIMRQLVKWSVVSTTKNLAETALELFVLSVCAVIAGLITYWMFLPTAYRCKRYFTMDLAEEGA